MTAPIVRRTLVLLGLAVLLLSAVPSVSASAVTKGAATSCHALASCSFIITNSNGTGGANTSTNTISFRLPGEAKITVGGVYTSKVVNVSGHVDHVVGTFAVSDINSGKVYFGSTNTFITVTPHCYRNGCSYTYSLVNGTINFKATGLDGTTSAVTCSPGTFWAGNSTVCTVTATNLANSSSPPTGRVSFAIGYGTYGNFSKNGTCTLSKGSCSVKFTPNEEQVGYVRIYASYLGNKVFYKSAASTLITITQGNN
ncbi:MAG: hypothetical protein L3K13_04340 [Thermoplasmata archaeon]|nr:hypothetical protein [Thermoplasmata archaeon]